MSYYHYKKQNYNVWFFKFWIIFIEFYKKKNKWCLNITIDNWNK